MKQRISNSDLIWLFHQKLDEYEDHPHSGRALAIIPKGKGGWMVAMPASVSRRKPDLAARIGTIEKQLRKLYTLAAE